MARNVKNILENNTDIEQIIRKLLDINSLKLEEFLLKTGISLDSYRKALTNKRLTGPNIENILETFDVNEGYLTGAEDLTSSGKLTLVHDEPAIPQKPLGVSEAIKTVVEEGTEYYVIPKIIFQKKYILVAEEQFDQDKHTFNRMLTILENELSKKEQLRTEPQKPEETK